MRYIIVLIIISGLIGVGFYYYSESASKYEEAKKEVLAIEPGFSDILEKRQVADEQIKIINLGFNEKNRELNAQISELKKELNFARKEKAKSIANIEVQFNPSRQDLKIKIRQLITELKLKESSLYATNKTIAKLTKLTKETTLPAGSSSFNQQAAEAQKWYEKTKSLKTQAQELAKDIGLLRDAIHLNRLKLKLLR